MNHIAIMRKEWGMTEKILDKRKTIESRWAAKKIAPWQKVSAGDVVYFKNSGEPVRIRAVVSHVVHIEKLTPAKVAAVLRKYGRRDGIGRKDMPMFLRLFKDKKYCVLIFLAGARAVRPFEIRKRGFGSMSAWMCTEDINSIRRA